MNAPELPADAARWPQRLLSRLRRHIVFKILAMALLMAAFFAAYFALLRHPQFAVTIMPLAALDRLIGFQPAALPVYLSLWFYLSLAPSQLVERRELLRYLFFATALCLFGLMIFFLWPTRAPAADVDWSAHRFYAELKAVDTSGNACPSLHAAFAVFSACWSARVLRQLRTASCAQLLNALWCLAILYSTLATKQHVALDVYAGTVLGAAFGVLSQYRLDSASSRRTLGRVEPRASSA